MHISFFSFFACISFTESQSAKIISNPPCASTAITFMLSSVYQRLCCSVLLMLIPLMQTSYYAVRNTQIQSCWKLQPLSYCQKHLFSLKNNVLGVKSPWYLSCLGVRGKAIETAVEDCPKYPR